MLTSPLMLSRLPIETFETVVGLAQEGCKAIAGFMRTKLLEHTTRLSLARGGGLRNQS